MLLHTDPTRFMSTIGVKKIPLIGWGTTAVDTIFVNRGNKESRAAARAELGQQLQARPYPPLTLFPEGQIGDNSQVNPFRYGAFEVAVDQNVDCLVCAIRYEPFDLVSWLDKDETLPQAVWRLTVANQRLDATVTPLEVLHPQDYPDAPSMANKAHSLVAAALS